MNVNIFNFNNFIEKNPLVQWVVDKYPEKTILTEKDLHDEIMSLKHAKWAYENQKWSFMGDELRLYLSTISDDFTYCDADSWVRDLEKLKMHSCCIEADRNINDGSYFRANKDTKWTKYWLNVYETENVKDMINYEMHMKYPTEIPVQHLNYTHYYLSMFSRLKKRHIGSTLCYTMFYDRAMKEILKGNDVLWLNTRIGDIYYQNMGATLYQYHILPMDVLEAQFQSIGIKLINLDV